MTGQTVQLPTYIDFLAGLKDRQQTTAGCASSASFSGAFGGYGSMGLGGWQGVPYSLPGMNPMYSTNFGFPSTTFSSSSSSNSSKSENNMTSEQKRALKRKLKTLLNLNIELSGSGAQKQFELVHNADKEGNDHVTLSVGAVASSAVGFVAFENAGKLFSIRRGYHGKKEVENLMADIIADNKAGSLAENYRAIEEAQKALIESQKRLEKKHGFLRKKPLTAEGDVIKTREGFWSFLGIGEEKTITVSDKGQKGAVKKYQEALKKAIKSGNKVEIMQATHDLNTASGILTGRGVLIKGNKFTGVNANDVEKLVENSHSSNAYLNIDQTVEGKFGRTKAALSSQSGFKASMKSAGGTFKGFMLFEAVLRFIPDMVKSYKNGSKADMDHDGQADGFKGGMGTALRQSWQSLLGMTVSSGGYAIGNELGKGGARLATKAVLRRISKKGIQNCTKWGAKIGSKAGIWGAAIGSIAGIVVGCALQLGGEKLINWLIPEQAKDTAEANVLAQEQGLEGALVAAENINQKMSENPDFKPADHAAVKKLQDNANQYNNLMQDQQLAELGIDPSAILKPETAQQQREQIQHLIDTLG